MANKGKRKLTASQEAFCKEYLVDFNATKAAERAKYSKKTAGSQGQRLLKNVEIQARVSELVKELNVEDPADTIRKCIAELQMIAFGDYADFVEWNEDGVKNWTPSEELRESGKTRLVQEVSETTTQSGGSKKLKLYDKRWAFEMLGKYYGFLKEKVEITNPDGSLQPIVNINIPSNGREKNYD